MLAAQGIISAQDLSDIQRGMAQIRAEIEAGSFQWLLDLEDVHLNIEKRLVELVGDAGKRLHTGRSRNDQVATDIRLWLREEIDTLIELLRQLRRALATVALDNAGTIMPASPTCRWPSPSPSATTCWPTPRCSAATPSAWPTAASASTACRWARPRWPARPTPSTASAWRARWALMASAATRWTPCPTATSPSNSAPPARWS